MWHAAASVDIKKGMDTSEATGAGLVTNESAILHVRAVKKL